MFFIKFLTEPGDQVLDIFAGSNTTGFVAEELGRKWMAFEEESAYLAASAFRFLGNSQNPDDALSLYEYLLRQQEPICLSNLKQLAVKL